jgi:hypothetical protein
VLHCSKWKLSSESHLDSAAIEIWDHMILQFSLN